MEVRARAPGKIILTGEHAVVHGSTAVASSIDLYTYVYLHFSTPSGILLSLSLSLSLVNFIPLFFQFPPRDCRYVFLLLLFG